FFSWPRPCSTPLVPSRSWRPTSAPARRGCASTAEAAASRAAPSAASPRRCPTPTDPWSSSDPTSRAPSLSPATSASSRRAAPPPPPGAPRAPPPVLPLPAVETSPYAELSPDRRAIMRRLATLFRLSQGFAGQVLVASAPALLRRVIPRAELGKLSDIVV